MRQAIVTKYMGPTNFRGSRIKATACAGSVTLEWDDALNVDENHLNAARALQKKFNWDCELIGGGLPTKDGNVYVQIDKQVTIYRSKTNPNISYISSKIGSFRYLEVLYSGRILKHTGNPVANVKRNIQRFEEHLKTMPWDGDMTKLSEVSDAMRTWVYSFDWEKRV